MKQNKENQIEREQPKSDGLVRRILNKLVIPIVALSAFFGSSCLIENPEIAMTIPYTINSKQKDPDYKKRIGGEVSVDLAVADSDKYAVRGRIGLESAELRDPLVEATNGSLTSNTAYGGVDFIWKVGQQSTFIPADAEYDVQTTKREAISAELKQKREQMEILTTDYKIAERSYLSAKLRYDNILLDIERKKQEGKDITDADRTELNASELNAERIHQETQKRHLELYNTKKLHDDLEVRLSQTPLPTGNPSWVVEPKQVFYLKAGLGYSKTSSVINAPGFIDETTSSDSMYATIAAGWDAKVSDHLKLNVETGINFSTSDNENVTGYFVFGAKF